MKKSFLLVLSLYLSFFLMAQESTHSKAYLGVTSNHVSTDKAKALNFENSNGVYVTEVIENSAAEKNGMKPFDYLIGIDGKSFSKNRSFHHAMQEYNAGDQAQVQLIRNGQELSVPVTFGKQSDAIYRKIPKDEQPFLGVKQDHYDWREKVPGVKVNIVRNSTAEQLGMQNNDIITSINNQPIIDWHDLATAVDNLKPGEAINIDFIRSDNKMSAASMIQSYGETYAKDHSSNSHNRHQSNQEEAKPQSDTDETETSEDANISIAGLEVEMEDVTQEEADDMKEKVGVDMPVINNLEIEKLNIFPNPNNGVFNLTFDLPNRGQTTIRIFNGLGRLVYQNDMQNFSGFFKDRIDISNSANGIYFLEVNQDGKSITQKVIIQDRD